MNNTYIRLLSSRHDSLRQDGPQGRVGTQKGQAGDAARGEGPTETGEGAKGHGGGGHTGWVGPIWRESSRPGRDVVLAGRSTRVRSPVLALLRQLGHARQFGDPNP